MYMCSHWSGRKEQDDQLNLLFKLMHEKEFHSYLILKILSNLSDLMRGKEIKPTTRRYPHNSTRNIIDIAVLDQQEIGYSGTC